MASGRCRRNPGNYSAEKVSRHRTDIKPLAITQPEGPSFALEGNQIAVAELGFCYRFQCPRRPYNPPRPLPDNGRKRPILYRGSLTEMVVPYGDPTPDAGPQERLRCRRIWNGHVRQQPAARLRLSRLHSSTSMPTCATAADGELTIPNAICIHEEDYGILWKHTDRRLPDTPEVRRSRRLVVSSISTVENYEYGFFWYFYQDGNIQFEIKLTGILSLGAVH